MYFTSYVLFPFSFLSYLLSIVLLHFHYISFKVGLIRINFFLYFFLRFSTVRDLGKIGTYCEHYYCRLKFTFIVDNRTLWNYFGTTTSKKSKASDRKSFRCEIRFAAFDHFAVRHGNFVLPVNDDHSNRQNIECAVYTQCGPPNSNDSIFIVAGGRIKICSWWATGFRRTFKAKTLDPLYDSFCINFQGHRQLVLFTTL